MGSAPDRRVQGERALWWIAILSDRFSRSVADASVLEHGDAAAIREVTKLLPLSGMMVPAIIGLMNAAAGQ